MQSSPSKNVPNQQSSLTDIPTLRKRARQDIQGGAVTAGYAADREVVLKLLNEALATEIVCVLRYKRHYFMASGIHAEPVAAEFLEHATQEMAHADYWPGVSFSCVGNPIFPPMDYQRAVMRNM